MRQLILLLVILAGLLVPVVASAQLKTLKVSGTVKDAKDEGLIGVSILVRTAEGTFGGVSGRNGEYEVNFSATDSLTVSYSYVGFQTYTFSAIASGDIRRDVILTDKSVTLGEVEVTASSINMKDDHVTYMPTKKQVNGANNGVMLLFNMMIPQLDVNLMNGSVGTVDNTRLGIFIDGRPADSGELSRLRPKDIARVEYYETPTGMFASTGNDRAMNIVTKKYTSGGYVDMRTNTHLLMPNGSYSVQASLDKNNVNILAMAGSNFSTTDMSVFSQENYKLDRDFTKFTYSDNSRTKSLSDYGLLRLSVKGKRSYFLVQAMLAWNKSPEQTNIQNVSYTNNAYPTATASNTSYGRSLSPVLNIYHQVNFNDKNVLYWNASYSFNHNKSRSSYIEGDFSPIISNVNEDYHSFSSNANFTHTFSDGSQLAVSLYENFYKSNSVYSGTSPSHQDMLTNEVYLIPYYMRNFGKKLKIYLNIGGGLSTSKVNGLEQITRFYARPGVNANYTINNTSSLSFTAYMGSFVPSLSTMNEAEVRLSEYEVKRGNPDLKSGKPVICNLSYLKNWKKFSLMLFANYYRVFDNTVNYYMAEGNTLVNTYMSDGFYNSYSFGTSGTLRLFNNSLQIKLSPSFEHSELGGIYGSKLNDLRFSTSLYYNIGSFSFSGYYNSFSKSLSSSPQYTTSPATYGLTASWGHKGLFVQVGCQNIFSGKTGYSRNNFNYGLYDKNIKTYSKWYGALAYVNISYSFDFGRKVERQNVNVDTSSKSGILK